jgi:serine protease AprX
MTMRRAQGHSPRSRLLFAMTVSLLTAGLAAVFGDENQSKIANQVMVGTSEGQQTSFIIYLSDQADLRAASRIKDQDERGWYVYNRLKEHAEATQTDLRARLAAAGVPYTSYWAVNMIVAHGGRELVNEMAARADVAAIEPNGPVEGIRDDTQPDDIDEGEAVDVVETGVTQTGAPALWASGFTGQGMVVANQDTGMRWTHASLRTKYRGWGGSIDTSDHNYNWWDSVHAQIAGDGGTNSPVNNPCGRNLMVPCDDNNHGTHTTGTVVGDDAGAGVGTGTNQIGVAPGARWIGCRNMDAGNGRASTYTECFQFFLAPTNLLGQSPNPALRPHAMNNSWGCPQAGELCPPNVMKTIVEVSVASGIFIVASNGNNGPACDTTRDPPAIYEATYSVGSITATNAVSAFSSRGVVTADGSGRMKPDIVARGQTVRSSIRGSDTQYGNSSGTSMASPHIVGSVAVLWSAVPDLVRDVGRTKWLLTRSANPNVTVPNNAALCGGIATIPNNHFGWGRVDVPAAYALEPSLRQSITFPAIGNRIVDSGSAALTATATSALPVSYSASGACTVSGSTVQFSGVGLCTVTGSQEGYDQYSISPAAPRPWYPADDVSQTFSIIYPFSGFERPITNGVLNTWPIGSEIRVKFGLGGNRGMGILAGGSPSVTPISCSTLAPIGSGVPAASTLGLQFDPLTAKYYYMWKTDKAWGRSCQRLDVTLADGTSHTANFQFK